MMSEFKVGDRVIVNRKSGIVIEGDRFYDRKGFKFALVRVEFLTPNAPYASMSSYYKPKYVEMDVQYYREERLKKLLNERED